MLIMPIQKHVYDKCTFEVLRYLFSVEKKVGYKWRRKQDMEK